MEPEVVARHCFRLCLLSFLLLRLEFFKVFILLQDLESRRARMWTSFSFLFDCLEALPSIVRMRRRGFLFYAHRPDASNLGWPFDRLTLFY